MTTENNWGKGLSADQIAAIRADLYDTGEKKGGWKRTYPPPPSSELLIESVDKTTPQTSEVVTEESLPFEEARKAPRHPYGN